MRSWPGGANYLMGPPQPFDESSGRIPRTSCELSVLKALARRPVGEWNDVSHLVQHRLSDTLAAAATDSTKDAATSWGGTNRTWTQPSRCSEPGKKETTVTAGNRRMPSVPVFLHRSGSRPRIGQSVLNLVSLRSETASRALPTIPHDVLGQVRRTGNLCPGETPRRGETQETVGMQTTRMSSKCPWNSRTSSLSEKGPSSLRVATRELEKTSVPGREFPPQPVGQV